MKTISDVDMRNEKCWWFATSVLTCTSSCNNKRILFNLNTKSKVSKQDKLLESA